MANPSNVYAVDCDVTPVTEETYEYQTVTTTQDYYPNEMIGVNGSELADKFDDTQSLRFVGIHAGSARLRIKSDSNANERLITVKKPRYITMYISSATAGTDEGKPVYAAYSNQVQFATGTYGNYVGLVKKVISSTLVQIDTMATHQTHDNTALTLAATGNDTLTRNHINRRIFVPNTAAKTVTLPAVAKVPIGAWMEFWKTTSDAFAITLDGNASETINGATTYALPMLANVKVRIVSDGSAWYVDGSKGPTSAPAIAAARTLTAADSGGVFTVAKTSAYAITLPTPAQGLYFKFMVLDTGANAVTISDGSAHLFGVVSINNVSTAMTGTTLTLASAGSVGDWVCFEGISATQYLVTGACIAAADIAIA